MASTQSPRESMPTDGGQAVPLVIAVVAIAALFLLGAAWFAVSLLDAAAARTAADAAARAGVADHSSSSASAAARANGGALVSFRWSGADLVVRVRVGRAVADARATIGGARFPTLDPRDRSSG